MNLHFGLFVLLYFLTDTTPVFGTCTDNVPKLNGLNLRSVNNIVTGDAHHIKDGELAEGWYSTVSSTGQFYRMSSRQNDGLPDLSQCGTRNPIYLDGTLPKLCDGKEISAKACYVTWDSICKTKLDIKVRLCSGKPQYYLPTPQGISGFCFEPEDARILAAPNYVFPRNPNVNVSIAYGEVLIPAKNKTYKIPHLEFTCGFPTDQRWFYYIQWFARVGHDDKIVQTFELTKNLTSTKLLEQHLLDNRIGLGTTIRCAVSVASDRNGQTTIPTFSDEFFAGIKVLTPTITIEKGLTGTIRFLQTVPIGCAEAGNGRDVCEPKISLYNVNENSSCPQSAVSVKDATHCGLTLQSVTYQQYMHGFTFGPQTMSMRVTTKQAISYRMKNSFDVLLQAEDYGSSHEIWKKYTVGRAHVNVAEDSTWKRKSCHCTADPQFDTFDGRHYYPTQSENIGEYLLYENTENGIQVQYKTFRCTTSGAGTCTCGVVVRTGGDLWMYSTCNGADYIGFTSCSDGLLIEDKISPTSYNIHTPSGTYVSVRMSNSTNYLDIDVYASPSDVGNTRGHCGTLNGNDTDDIAKITGEVFTKKFFFGTNINDYYESWRLRGTRNYFDKNNLHPPSWNKSQMSCVCSKSSSLHPEVHCSADQTTVCTNTRRSPVCNSRRKRSAYRHRIYMDRVFDKMSISVSFSDDRHERSTSTVSYEEAYAKCVEFFSNQTTYTLQNSVPDSRMNDSLRSCADDATIDITQTSWMKSHFESWVRKIENEIGRNISYRETHPAEMKQFKDIRCSDDCNGNGKCVKGVCECDPGFSGNTCFINKAAVLEISEIEGGGECDVKEDSECHKCLQIKSRYLLEDFKCNITINEINSEGHSRLAGQYQKTGEYENVFEGHCCPKLESGRHRRSVSSPGSFVTKYLVSVSNDGIHYGPSRHVYVFDSTCQEFVVLPSGDLLFSLKQDTCFIDGMCHVKGLKSTLNSCNMCWPDMSKYTWTQGCYIDDRNTNKEGETNGISGNHVTIIVALSVTGVVVFGLTALLVIWKLKRPTRPEVGIPKDEPPSYVSMPSNKRFESLSFQASQVPPPDYSKLKA